MDNELIEYIKTSIQKLLVERPESADTLDGIHRWWIQWPEVPESIDITRVALEQLELEGIVEALTIGGRQIWRKRR